MKNYMKYIILGGCIIIIGVIYGVFFLNKNSTENVNSESDKIDTSDVEENIVEENTTVENVSSEEIIEEEQNNVVSDNLEENKIAEENVKNTETVYEQDNDVGSTEKKQEAINLVKEKWGQDESVTFRCDSVTTKGEYIIAVVSKNGSGVKNYFKVNLEKNEVEIHY